MKGAEGVYLNRSPSWGKVGLETGRGLRDKPVCTLRHPPRPEPPGTGYPGGMAEITPPRQESSKPGAGPAAEGMRELLVDFIGNSTVSDIPLRKLSRLVKALCFVLC